MAQNSDRRRHQRVPLRFLLEVNHSGRPVLGHATDISESGLCLHWPSPYLPETPLRLSLPLGETRGRLRACEVEARVVRRKGDELGLIFSQKMLPAYRLQLRDYVFRQAR